MVVVVSDIANRLTGSVRVDKGDRVYDAGERR